MLRDSLNSMKASPKLTVSRGAGAALLAAFLLTIQLAPADVARGAARQRELALRNSVMREATSPAKGAACANCCAANAMAGGSIVITTGSHLPVTSKRRQQITDSAQNVQALDRKQLERTGAGSISGAVRRLTP